MFGRSSRLLLVLLCESQIFFVLVSLKCLSLRWRGAFTGSFRRSSLKSSGMFRTSRYRAIWNPDLSLPDMLPKYSGSFITSQISFFWHSRSL